MEDLFIFIGIYIFIGIIFVIRMVYLICRNWDGVKESIPGITILVAVMVLFVAVLAWPIILIDES